MISIIGPETARADAPSRRRVPGEDSFNTALLRWGLIGQGAYYAIAGVWPIIHMRSFITVSGPKWDLWLVVTVGALLAVIGMVLLMAALRSRITQEIFALAIGIAVVLIIVDVYYVSIHRIWPIYMGDAFVEAAIVLTLLFGLANSHLVESRKGSRKEGDQTGRMEGQSAPWGNG